MENLKDENGRSMIEMLGVLAIIGVLSVGGIAGYSKAMTKYRINKTIEQITLIAGNVRTFFANQRNYHGLVFPNLENNDIVKKAKLIPEDMWELTDGKLTGATNAFGTYFGIEAADKATSGDYKAFYLQLYNIPQEACIELLSYDWSNANINVAHTVSISSVEDVDMYAKFPIDVDKAITMCGYENSVDSINFYVDVDVNSSFWQDYF